MEQGSVKETLTQVSDAEVLWRSCADVLRAQVSDAVWLTCFHAAVGVSADDDEFVLGVPSPVFKDRIETRYVGLLEGALADVGAEGMSVRVQVVPGASPPADDAPTPEVEASATPEPAPTATTDEVGAATSARRGATQINPRYTFEDFVPGMSNRFAHAAALAVAETPARNYNPLFIYGGPGLGKTHLLQAIGHYVHENYPGKTVRYVTTEQFLNEYVDAIRTGELRSAFKQRYRTADVFLLDDIQFIEGREGTQEELFHTFNHLHQANSQIVLSSDRMPDRIETLEDRLRSRFKMGLITEINPPDLETRMAILRKKAETEQPVPSPDVLEFIATHITANIRELEGALTRVCAYASLTNEPITTDLAERVLSDIIADNEPRPITPDAILDATSEMFSFSIEEIRGKSRRRPLVTARQISMYVFREMTDLSYPAIAREFGGRDHTTVIHAVEKVTNLMKERRQVYDQVTALTQNVRAGR